MKKILTTILLEQLKAETRQLILEAKQLLREDPEVLTTQPVAGSWSVAQAIEHLNTYGRYYLPIMRKSILDNPLKPSPTYNPGWLGNYFTKSMKPTADKQIKNKMKAMKGYIPVPELDSKAVLDEFLAQQQEKLNLLETAGHTNISKIRIPISIAKFIRLKLGDTFRFLIAHEQRHMIQAQNAVQVIRSGNFAVA